MDVERVKQTMIVWNLFYRLNVRDSQKSTVREDLGTNTMKRVKKKGTLKKLQNLILFIADALPTYYHCRRDVLLLNKIKFCDVLS